MRYPVAVCLLVTLALVAGCVSPQTARPQVADEPTDPDAVPTVGSKTEVGNVSPLPVYGIGLVINLKGTGSTPPVGEMRQELERSLASAGFQPKEILADDSRSTSMVLISGMIAAGARPGDPIAVQITLPEGSRTTSLKGGYLIPVDLITAANASEVREAMQAAGMTSRPSSAGNAGVLKGNVVARAEGPLVSGAIVSAEKSRGTESDEVSEAVIAQVWEGPISKLPRPYTFELVSQDRRPGLVLEIAERLNASFSHHSYDRRAVADAKAVKPSPVVLVQVPPTYRHNHYRFLLVARHVPLVPVTTDHPYRKRLEQELLDPATAITAAVKLEALGVESRKPLRVGLESDSAWVRFAAAEALAYLGQTDGANELAQLASRHPGLRFHCLKALAALDDAASTMKLNDLMAVGEPALRYGAFDALRVADPRSDTIRGERAATRSFWVHRVSPGSAGMVHARSMNRTEIVIFGDGGKLTGPFTLPIGNDYTVAVTADGSLATVSKIVNTEEGADAVKKTCRPELGAVLLTMGEMGAGYTEAVEFCRRTDNARVLGGSFYVDSLPPALPVPELATFARIDPTLEKVNLEVIRVGKGELKADNEALSLPTEADSVKSKQQQESDLSPLNRKPGRIFGPKKTEGETDATTPTPVDNGPAFNREPGRLISKK